MKYCTVLHSCGRSYRVPYVYEDDVFSNRIDCACYTKFFPTKMMVEFDKPSITELYFLISEERKRFTIYQVNDWLREKYKAKSFSQLNRDQLEEFLKFLKEQQA